MLPQIEIHTWYTFTILTSGEPYNLYRIFEYENNNLPSKFFFIGF